MGMERVVVIMIKNILFDLDGTLLPMDQDIFIGAYFKRLALKLAPCGYEPQKLQAGIWSGMAAMVANDGSRTNEEAFWAEFSGIFGEKVREDEPLFEAYYRNEFQEVAKACGYTDKAASVVRAAGEKGLRVILATNPVFPQVATYSRIGWAGLKPEDFELVTTYEHSCYCKPNPRYFTEIMQKLSLNPAECLMVGNDVEEDMVAGTAAGMQVFLLTDCLINKRERDLSDYRQGSFDELEKMIHEEL